ILPLLETPLGELLLACAQKRLSEQPPIVWKSGASACVVMAAEGYPGPFKKGERITGIEEAEEQGAIVFHAGTKTKQQVLLTDGGRVLGVTVTDETFDAALSKAYTAVNSIQFDGAYYRRDIGDRVRTTESAAS
ncbi:MAG TPA: phosphoribosylglycinamide synthetase C domain-containing protein, partial [Candidatus Sericytochromatia bacterium]